MLNENVQYWQNPLYKAYWALKGACTINRVYSIDVLWVSEIQAKICCRES